MIEIGELGMGTVAIITIPRKHIESMRIEVILDAVRTIPDDALIVPKIIGYTDGPRDLWQVHAIRRFFQTALLRDTGMLARMPTTYQRFMRRCVIGFVGEADADRAAEAIAMRTEWTSIACAAGIDPANTFEVLSV